MSPQIAFLFRISFLVLFFTLLQAPLEAKRVLPEERILKTKNLHQHGKLKYKFSLKKKRKKRPNPKKYKNGAGPLWPSVLFWYGLIPLGIAALFLFAFLATPISMLLWYIALGASVLWLGITGVVFFPIQYVGLLGGMGAILAHFIVYNSIFLLTGGIALVITAILALSSMVLMFLIGTRKYQPKAK